MKWADRCPVASVLSINERVSVPMMDVRVMRMGVLDRGVSMGMGVRFAGWIVGLVDMLVMGVMRVSVGMGQRIMAMEMVVPFGQVQINADPHK